MAKIYGLFGAMKGKVADVVMAVRYGEQIVRKYQPIVSNPRTAAQVESRAKLKMLSQLTAIMAPYIAIQRMGTKTSRNLFVKTNYPFVSYNNNQANIALDLVQLTKSVVGLPAVSINRVENNIRAGLDESNLAGISRVVFAFFEKEPDETLRAYDSVVVNNTGQSGWLVAEVPSTSNSVVVLAYGIRDNTESARVAFGNLQAPSADTVAKLLVSRTLTEADVTLTVTKGATLAALPANMIHGNENSPEDDNRSVKKSK